MDILPASVKYIHVASVGYNPYDINALSARGIKLFNAPGFPTESVADMALNLAWSTYRYTTAFDFALRTTGHTDTARKAIALFDNKNGVPNFEAAKSHTLFEFGHSVGGKIASDPTGQRVGIAGFGAIGKRIGARLNALGMNVHYLKRTPLDSKEAADLGYNAACHTTFDSLCKVSDLLILSLPASPETKHIVNDNTIKLMPDGVKIVNVGRGELIDDNALLRGLKSGKISAVGLDVFNNEPDVNPELLKRYDVTVLPHIAGSTVNTYVNCHSYILTNLKNAILFGDTSRAVNQIYTHSR